MKLTVDNLEFNITSDIIEARGYKDNVILSKFSSSRTLEVNLHGYATPSENGSLMTVIREEN